MKSINEERRRQENQKNKKTLETHTHTHTHSHEKQITATKPRRNLLFLTCERFQKAKNTQSLIVK